MLRFLTAGESHGQSLTVVIEGVPAGLALFPKDIDRDLRRRQAGYGRGGRMRIESDEARITAGVRAGRTLGSPIALVIPNRDWVNWTAVMPVEAAALKNASTTPRPGHADLAGALKYGHRDVRNVLERASARETAARVAVGAVARKLLAEFGVDIVGHVVAIGTVEARRIPASVGVLRRRAEGSPVRCADAAAARAQVRLINRIRAARDSIGGIVEVRAAGLPVGLGSHVHWDRRLDGRIAGAVMSIQAFKGVAIGEAFAVSRLPGSRAHDEIRYDRRRGFFRRTNRAGGLEGGMTNGEDVIVRAAVKPVSTLMRPLATVDLVSKRPARALRERSDVCIVPPAAVVAEAVVAVELARAMQEKFGGDSLAEMKRNHRGYLRQIRRF